MSNLQKYHVSKNLFDGTLYGGAWAPNFVINTDGINPDIYKSLKIYLKAGAYTVSFARHVNIVRRLFDGGYNQDTLADISELTFTISNDGYIGISFRATATPAINWDNSPIMVNIGSTALPYEPYTTDVWHDLAPQQYINGVFVDNANIPEKYSGGLWG